LIDCAHSTSLAQTTPGSIIYPENVNTNEFLDVGVATFDGAGISYGVTDTLGNTYTLTAATTTPNYATNKGLIYHAYTKSASSGADTITVAIPSPSTTNIAIVACRYKNVGGVDGSVATATLDNNPNGGTANISTTNTTTIDGDVLSTFAAGSSFNQDERIMPGTVEYNSWGNQGGGPNGFMGHFHAGNAGSIGATLVTRANHGFGNTGTFAMQTLALKPSCTICVTDSILPDAGNGTTYDAQMHCVGGSGAQTFSIVSGTLPTGLSMNSAGHITGSTTVNGVTALGFQCTDGTVTSSTQTLNLRVNQVANVPTIVGQYTSTSDVSGPWQSVNVNCGDSIVVMARGDDTHYFDGWVQAASGVNNYINDGFGSPVRRLEGWISGAMSAPWSVFVIGPVTQTGSDLITFANNQDASSANPVSLVAVVRNGELVDEATGVSATTTTASGTFGTSYTTVVNNTLLLTGVFEGSGETGYATPTLSAPWSTLYAGTNPLPSDSIVSLYASTTPASPTTVSGTVSYTGGSTDYTPWAQVIVPIRPLVVGAVTCSGFNGPGERYRRTTW